MSGVFVTGHMRSGTSMTAGLFARHGVFFGETGGPTNNNRKGNNENDWLVEKLRPQTMPHNWPDAWFGQLIEEGWDGKTPWGAKAVAVHWPVMEHTAPDVVVLCYRPMEDILASCERFGSGERYSRAYREPMVRKHWEIMAEIEADYGGTVVSVNTPDLVGGDYRQVRPAFEALGIPFCPEIADQWIEPDLYHV